MKREFIQESQAIIGHWLAKTPENIPCDAVFTERTNQGKEFVLLYFHFFIIGAQNRFHWLFRQQELRGRTFTLCGLERQYGKSDKQFTIKITSFGTFKFLYCGQKYYYIFV